MQLARPRRRAAFMGLTPLIDMIFLLLLFFLLGSDFADFGQSRLAPPRGTGGDSSASQPLLISLSAQGALQLDSQPISQTALRQRARTALVRDPEQVFVVMPQARANVQMVADTLDVLTAAGAQAITLERDVFDIDLEDF